MYSNAQTTVISFNTVREVFQIPSAHVQSPIRFNRSIYLSFLKSALLTTTPNQCKCLPFPQYTNTPCCIIYNLIRRVYNRLKIHHPTKQLKRLGVNARIYLPLKIFPSVVCLSYSMNETYSSNRCRRVYKPTLHNLHVRMKRIYWQSYFSFQ